LRIIDFSNELIRLSSVPQSRYCKTAVNHGLRPNAEKERATPKSTAPLLARTQRFYVGLDM